MSLENAADNLAFLGKDYPGRIVVVSLSEDGQSWRLFTGMGGRSEGSKNRYYAEYEDLSGHGNYVRTEVHNPSLQRGSATATLYTAQRNWSNWHVASNGEQTDGIGIALALKGRANGTEAFVAGQKLYRDEGPKNANTSRITAAVGLREGYALMGQVIYNPDNPLEPHRRRHIISPDRADYPITPGIGYLLTTYNGEGGTGAYQGGPIRLELPGSLEGNMITIWQAWDPETKAGLVGKEISIGEIAEGMQRTRFSYMSIHSGRQSLIAV